MTSSDTDSSREEDRKKKKKKKHSSNDEKKKRKRKDDRKKSKRKRKRRHSSDDGSFSSDYSSEPRKKKAVNQRLLAKLEARGETLEERNARRAQKKAAHIQATLGYTAEDNPFNDPNLHETFTWKKREEQAQPGKKKENALVEIEKVRQRREQREAERAEMQRIREEESRMRELEGFDEFARKEEEFHLQQQRQRSAIRLVEGREKPVDVLAKNLLLFGLTEAQKQDRSSVKYQERFNALDALESLEAELEEPHALLKKLKLDELEELVEDIDAFRSLEREASYAAETRDGEVNPVIVHWDALKIVAEDEIMYLNSGGESGSHAKLVIEIQKIFQGQSAGDLQKLKSEALSKLRGANSSGSDTDYWKSVVQQLEVHLAKVELSELHSKMLVRQLHKLEKKKEEIAQKPKKSSADSKSEEALPTATPLPDNVEAAFGDLEEELGLTSEISVDTGKDAIADKYCPRKPRFFNRVRTGYDWNKYNQTHYDEDNPPPKIVQGYKFNIFYPDLIDPTKTPQFVLERADTDEFCIIRFKAGPPYEDVAFKIINREWNKSRKRGYKCTFERGVLSLYFNFTTHWYRR